ncbi:MAG: hypothetical protein ACRDIB_13915, partial [Ardenticatenaceae bacterium]
PTLPPVAGCTFAIAPVFAGFYNEDNMGCPTSDPQTGTGSYQLFEEGFMVHDPIADRIFVFTTPDDDDDDDNARIEREWLAFDDEWQPGDEEFSCPQAEQEGGPVRGFGLVWCDNPQVRNTLGNIESGETLGELTLQSTQFALLINVPARPAQLALFGNQTYVERQ